MNMSFSWNHKEKKDDGSIYESNLAVPIKLVNSCDSGYGYHGTLICNKCNSKVNQIYVCSSCENQATIGDIKKRKDERTELIYEEQIRQEFMKNEIADKTIRVIDEIDINTVLYRIERFEKTYEMFNSEATVSPVINKIYNFLKKKNLALVCEFGYSNRGKSNKLGGIVIAGDGKLILCQLRDYRLVRPPKQQGLPQPEFDATAEILNNVSENHYPASYERFLDMIKNGEEIKVTAIKEQPIEVECDFLD